jgi:hypothetical protein
MADHGRVPRMDQTNCPHCGAAWGITLMPVRFGAPSAPHYGGACICGHPLKDLEALGGGAASFRLLKDASSAE